MDFGATPMGRLMADVDWADNPVGPLERWPHALRTAVRIALNSKYPMFVAWGPELIFLYNDAFQPVLGDKHPAALATRTQDIWSDVWEHVSPIMERALQGEGTYWEDMELVMNRSGFDEQTFFTFSYFPLHDDDGTIGGIMSACNETTGRVVGERRLATLNALAAQAGRASTVPEACARAAQALRVHPDQVPWVAVYLPDDDPTILTRSAFTELPPDVDMPVRIAEEGLPRAAGDATVLPLRSTTGGDSIGALVLGRSPLRPPDQAHREFLSLVAEHVASLLHAADALEAERRRADALAELDRAKTEFFSNVSHEFRTPLSLLLGPIADALDDVESADPALQRERLVIARRNGQRLLRLVNTLLDFSRIEAGRARIDPQPTDLAEMTADLASVFRAAAEAAGLTLDVSCPPLSAPVPVDREMWEKIVLNLLSNALKFTFEGGIRVGLREVDDQVELTVADTGVGIPPEELPRLFERFHRVAGVRARTHEGTGIGLALVRELAALHGGCVTAESVTGAGTTFRVVIPRTQPVPAPQGDDSMASTALGAAPFVEEAMRWLPADTADGPAPRMAGVRGRPLGPTGARILLADDNADMRAYVGRLLGERWDVVQCRDGDDALRAARENPPDLVISDVMMPGLDGFALLRALRDDPPTRGVPVILLSARAGQEAVLEGLGAGADDYLVKPFSAQELLTRVGAHLELAAVRAEVARADREAETSRVLAAEQARFREMTESAGDMIGRYAPDSTIHYVSPSCRTLLGYAPEELVGVRAFDLIHPDDIVLNRGNLDQLADAPCVVRTTSRWRRRDGRYTWLEHETRSVHEDGRMVEMLDIARDVSARVTAEQALLRERDYTASLVASLGDGIATVRADGTTVRVSGRMGDMIGRRAEEVRGARLPIDGMPDTAAGWGDLLAAARPGAPAERDGALRRADGSTLPVLVTVTRLDSAEGDALALVTVKDIREREAARRAKDEFVSLASHELRTPLTSVVGFLDLAVERCPGPGNHAHMRHLTLARRNAGRLQRLVEDILDLSRSDSGRLVLHLGDVDPAPLLVECVDSALPAARERGVHLSLDVGEPAAVRGDRHRLAQVVDNLIANALKFTPVGGRVDVRAAVDGGHVRVEVADTGIGIAADDLAHVFDRFYRGTQATERTVPGTGLGLAVARMIVDSHGGRIAIDSREGAGTTVTVTLPVADGAAPAGGA